MIRWVAAIAAGLASWTLLTNDVFAEEAEAAVGSEVNPLNMMLAIVYIIIVMALIYVILLCIDKFAKKNKKNDAPPEERAEDENSGDVEKDE